MTRPRIRRRRPQAQSRKRVLVCSVRLSSEEKAILSAAATTAGITLSAFLARSGLAAADDLDRSAAMIAGRREVVAELFAARRHLGHVGNNLNQVARVLNSGGSPSGIDAVVSSVAEAVQRVQQATDRLLSSEMGDPRAYRSSPS